MYEVQLDPYLTLIYGTGFKFIDDNQPQKSVRISYLSI